MPPAHRRSELHRHIVAIMDETGEDDPFEAVRIKARAIVTDFRQTFGEEPPFNVKAVASLRGLHWSDDDPRFSDDSEISPESDGRVVLRVNAARPHTRQRFSICHEIGHTLFPDYQLAVRCRKGRDRSFADPSDLLETLCDVAASELMFPTPWFKDRIAGMTVSAAGLAALAQDYEASREAALRRFVELSCEYRAVVFFSWKLKPKQESQLQRDRNQLFMFDEDPVADAESKRMLRVDYAIVNEAFQRRCGNHIPKDKSVDSRGPLYQAAADHRCIDGDDYLDLGPIHGRFIIHAVPIYTTTDDLGPNGECSIAAVIQPQ